MKRNAVTAFSGVILFILVLTILSCGQNSQELHQKALQYQDQGQYGKAEKNLTQALKKSPQNHVYWKDLGNVYMIGYGDLDKALDCYNKALSFQPDYVNAQHNIGVILRKKGKIAQAQEKFLQVIQKKPQFHFSYVELANTYLAQKKYTLAFESALRASQLEPEYSQSWYQLAHIVWKYGSHLQTKTKAPQKLAWQYILKALAFDPNYGQAMYLAAQIAESGNDRKNALSYYKQYLDYIQDRINQEKKSRNNDQKNDQLKELLDTKNNIQNKIGFLKK